jgi:hypothetical protein
LASGYAAYVLAYTGLRDRQKTVDIAFISLVFSLIATFVLTLSAKRDIGPVNASRLAFAATVVAGVGKVSREVSALKPGLNPAHLRLAKVKVLAAKSLLDSGD